MTTISNSELSAYSDCERKHHYSYHRQIKPIEDKPFFRLGGLGHLGLQKFYESLNDSSVEASWTNASDAIMEEDEELGLKIEVLSLLRKYVDYYGKKDKTNYKVHAVEKVFITKLVPGLDFGYIPDLVWERIVGPERGRMSVVDHKWLYNFKSTDDVELDIQIPRYMQALINDGWPIKSGMFNQIRTRDLKNPTPAEIFRRTPVPTTKAKLANIWSETQRKAIKVQEAKENPIDPLRSMSQMVCRNCGFKGLCIGELNGSTNPALLRLYRPRTRRELVAEDGQGAQGSIG